MQETCSHEGCEHPRRSKGLCSYHYQWKQRGGEPKRKLKAGRQPPTACKVQWCDRLVLARNLCVGHYQRERNGQPLDVPFKTRHLPGTSCIEEGCTTKPYAHLRCQSHYNRWMRQPSRPEGHDRDWWKEVNYTSAHLRAKTLWGAAKNHPCIKCGKTSHAWAYDGTDEDQLYGPTGSEDYHCFYSRFPEFYMPMCNPCHSARDNAKVREELREYREWKNRTGKSLADLDAA